MLALGLLVVLALFVVLPAFGVVGSAVPPASSPLGVQAIEYNTGGQSNDCAVFYGTSTASKPSYQYRIDNPKTGTYTTVVNGSSVSFKLLLNPASAQSLPAYSKDKYVSFSATGAKIVDVGIKGGTNTTRYNYAGQPGGYVTGHDVLSGDPLDGNLHAPAQSVGANGDPIQLYSVSNLTFCFNLGSVSGSIYQDQNQNTTNDTGDTPLSGWSVRLYKLSNPVVKVAETVSAGDGLYSLGVGFTPGTKYRLCESPPSGTWAQTQPSPQSTSVCSINANELPKGYEFTPTSTASDVTGQDFGNVPDGLPCIQGPFGLADQSYLIKLAVCKPNLFVFNGGTDAGRPFVSVWAADQTQPKVPMVERITWPFSANTQNPFKLIYTDTFPFVRANAVEMLYCKVDPRTAEFDLGSLYDQYSERAAVLPQGHTSCLITTTEKTPTAPGGSNTYVAYVYSAIAGGRSAP